MARKATDKQRLPIMVRKPKRVWPGLDKEGLHLKSIAGDGNCLFASLSDQLYGNPDRHGEIRAKIIEHMRDYRPLYEDFVHANDIIQKRATRSATESVRKQMEEDTFEGYLTGMSRLGTFGGQPELLAFVRAYDQDVMVHLPPSDGREVPSHDVKNEREANANVKPALHICYGGDEDRSPHYDSSQKVEEKDEASLTRPKAYNRQNLQTIQQNSNLSPRAVRGMKADPSRDMMHELVTRGSKDLRGNLDILNAQRARSPSVASNYSTSSKRSFEEEGEQPRSAKRTDRKISSLRGHAAFKQYTASTNLTIPDTKSQPTSSGPPTPTSSQDTDSSSDQVEQTGEMSRSTVNSPIEIIDLCDDDDDKEDTHGVTSTILPHRPELYSTRTQIPIFDRQVTSKQPSIGADASRSTLQI